MIWFVMLTLDKIIHLSLSNVFLSRSLVTCLSHKHSDGIILIFYTCREILNLPDSKDADEDFLLRPATEKINKPKCKQYVREKLTMKSSGEGFVAKIH